MTPFLIVLLCVSIAGLIMLLASKRWETATGRVLFSEVRPAAGRILGGGLHFVERRAPALLRELAWTLYRTVRRWLHVGTAWAVLRAEALLERVLHTLRHTTVTSGNGEASAFLREVAEHKKLLQKSDSTEKKNAIYEE